MKDIFTDIIKNHRWLEVPCGSGSTLRYTRSLRENLPGFLKEHGITSMLDLPCGDHSWMSLVEFSPGFQYIGADIVDFMIAQNQTKYPSKDFRVMDLCCDSLPEVDLLFCRDCLFHLSDADVLNAIDNIQASPVKYVMTTTYPRAQNRDIRTGGFRELNLQSRPYNLDQPIAWLDDSGNGHSDRVMALWTRQQFQTKE
jgi:hypothetical protein